MAATMKMKCMAVVPSRRIGPVGLALVGLLLSDSHRAAAQGEPPPDGATPPPTAPDQPGADPSPAPDSAAPEPGDDTAPGPGRAVPQPGGAAPQPEDAAPEPAETAPPVDSVVPGPGIDAGSRPEADAPEGRATTPTAAERVPEVVDGPSVAASTQVPAPQEPADVSQPPPDGEEEEIIVTGSRIRRSVFGSGPPIVSMNREQIQRTGAHTVEDVIQNITIASGSGYRGGGNGPASFGTAAINLRGLGPGSTLVLLNGRRMVPSAQGISQAYVDISTIPLSVVERIDVLKTGASAIYGTDALAGVINIITRKDWEGLMLQTDGRSTTNGFDQREATASAAIGASGEDARVIGALSYHRTTPLAAPDRDFTSVEGPPGGQGGNRSPGGSPSSYITSGGLVADPDCEQAPGSRIEEGTFGPLCTFSFNDFRWLTPDLERASAFMSAEYDISDNTRAFLEANLSKMRMENISSPSLPPAVRSTVPENHVDNPFGSDAIAIGRPLGASAGGVITSSDDDTLRVALGLEGDLGALAANTIVEDWEWNLTTTFGVSRYSRVFPDTITPRYEEALNACSDPSDLSECFNPFYSSVLGTGTPNSQAVIDGFTGALQGTVDQHLQTYGAGLSGSMFPLPGGNAAFALGAELRREQRSSELDHDSNQNDLAFFFGNPDAYAERDVGAEYLELLWPLLDGLELQTAGRAEQYPSENQLSWGASLTANPGRLASSEQQVLRGLTLRGSVSKSFRAPTLFQTFNGSTTITASLDDGGATPVRRPVEQQGNADLEGEHALSFNAGFTWRPVDELTVGLDFWNYTIENYIVAENAQRLLAEERAGMPDPRVVRDEMGALQAVRVSLINLPGDTTIRGIDGSAMVRLDTTAGKLSFGTEGSLMLAYRIPRELVPNVEDTEGNTVEPPFCDAESCNVAGYYNEASEAAPLPVLRLNLPINWQLNEHTLGLVLHVMSGLEDWAPSRYDSDPDGGPRTIDSFITLDFQYMLTLGHVVGKMTRLRVGIINVLDQAPPFVDVLDSFAPTLHDPRGRMVYASLAQEL